MCRCRRSLRLPLLAVALLLVIPSPSLLARGKGEDSVAKVERAKGMVALNLGRYEEAIEHLSQAYTLTQDPPLLFSLGQSYRLAGQPDKALAAYSSFLRAAGSMPKYRAQLERATAEIESITATSCLVKRPPERPAQDKQLDNLMTAPAPVAAAEVEPAPVAEQKAEPAPAAVEPPPIALAPPPPPPPPSPALTLSSKENEPPPSPPSHFYSKWWFWTSVGVALAAGGAAAWWFTRPENQVPASTYGAIKVSP
ncbi:MAG: tetratricopeptide repeat protein [Polyangia bacterium]